MALKRLPAKFYRSDSGREPVREWLKSLPDTDRRIVGEDIKDVEFAWPLGLPLVRSLGRELWEVRSSLTQGRIARVIFCVAEGEMILLHGFIKKTQKTPPQEMELAEADERTVAMNKKNVGSSFDDFLREEGIYEEVTAAAVKRVLARQIAAEMTEQKLTKAAMAQRMQTSRAQLDRLLDPENDSVTLNTLLKAATAVGRQIHLELV